jgi:hypothetical protein
MTWPAPETLIALNGSMRGGRGQFDGPMNTLSVTKKPRDSS